MECSSSFWYSYPFGLCVLRYPKLKQQQKIRCRERLALFEQKKMAPVLGNQPLVLGKSVTDFGKMSHRLWENEPPTLGKSVTDFGKNLLPTLGK